MSTANPAIIAPRSAASAMARDYVELIKLRVTSLIVMTAWTGYFMGAAKSGVSSWSCGMVHALIGIGLVSGGTAAMNEVFERDVDSLMRRTADRPLPSKRMGMTRAMAIASFLVFGGGAYLAVMTNTLTVVLTMLTAVLYLGAYTPLKRVTPICTFIGAIPGAMPPLLGWTAARGRIEAEGLILFAIVFCWQFPHFYSIAWMYREDYARARIKMLPVIEENGSWTRREIIGYSLALIPATVLPAFRRVSARRRCRRRRLAFTPGTC